MFFYKSGRHWGVRVSLGALNYKMALSFKVPPTPPIEPKPKGKNESCLAQVVLALMSDNTVSEPRRNHAMASELVPGLI